MTKDRHRPLRGGNLHEQNKTRVKAILEELKRQVGKLYQSLHKATWLIETCAQCEGTTYGLAFIKHITSLRKAKKLVEAFGLNTEELEKSTTASYFRPGSTPDEIIRRTPQVVRIHLSSTRRICDQLLTFLGSANVNEEDEAKIHSLLILITSIKECNEDTRSCFHCHEETENKAPLKPEQQRKKDFPVSELEQRIAQTAELAAPPSSARCDQETGEFEPELLQQFRVKQDP